MPVAARGGAKAVPGGDAVGNGGDAACVGAVGEAGELQVGVALSRRLEAGDAGEEAAIDLGQDDMHGQIGGRQAALGHGPVAAPRGGEGDLEHRAAGAVER